ncbi:uncharacterized protein LOC130222178 isoform X2 [Danio aesculapii]|uniref:uncharacterized protein LOC130222178 isoform X2 n=1 Tax=Danio aesculapii TaxID=1142201 RepID=UPI0024C02B31|nr:uncharacterized protein LOC130222178 isoform X2 [Danio aesculapii]
MTEERVKDSLSEIHRVRSRSRVSSSVFLLNDCSKLHQNIRSKHHLPDLSEETPSSAKSVRSGSCVSSSVSLKSDVSMGKPPNLREKTPSSAQSVEYELAASGDETHRRHKSFTDNLQWIFQNLESKMIRFLKNELGNFKKILQEENSQEFVKDYNENRSRITEAALDLTLFFLRKMKQDQAADTLEVCPAFLVSCQSCVCRQAVFPASPLVCAFGLPQCLSSILSQRRSISSTEHHSLPHSNPFELRC